jgi:small subunit ribosomal protein S6
MMRFNEKHTFMVLKILNCMKFKFFIYLQLQNFAVSLSGNGETGRRTILRGWRHTGVWVQVPLPALLKDAGKLIFSVFCYITDRFIKAITERTGLKDRQNHLIFRHINNKLIALNIFNTTILNMVKRNYEIYLIIDGNFDDPAVEEVISKYEKFFKKNGADILNIDKIGRRRLAYQIKRRVNGYYVCYELSASSALVSKFEKTVRIDENVLRSLSAFMSSRDLKEKHDYFTKKALLINAVTQVVPETAAAPETAESVEQTEKK